jgi:hypothetical protein
MRNLTFHLSRVSRVSRVLKLKQVPVMVIIQWIGLTLICLLPSFLSMSCATSQPENLKPLPELPPYARVEHPSTYQKGDLEALFRSNDAPSEAVLASCEGEIQKMKSRNASPFEIESAVAAAIGNDPVQYHWCFYHQLRSLDLKLSQEEYISQKQKIILEAYEFLVPVAKVFRRDFAESRYFKWSVTTYRRYSDLYFSRQVEPSAETTALLVDDANSGVSFISRAPASVAKPPKTDEKTNEVSKTEAATKSN